MLVWAKLSGEDLQPSLAILFGMNLMNRKGGQK